MGKMNPLHLLWMIPLAGAVGLFWGLLLAAAGRYDEDEKEYSGLLTEDEE